MAEWIIQKHSPAPLNKRIVGFITKLNSFGAEGWFSGVVKHNEVIGCDMFVSDAGGNSFLSDMPLYILISNPKEEEIKKAEL